MFQLKNGVVYLTKGDSAALTVSLQDQNGDLYQMEDGDTLTLTVRSMPNAESDIILQKTSDTMTIEIEPNDTKAADVGQYSADIQLRLLDGHVFTVWPDPDEKMMKNDKSSWKNFWITPEVTA